MKSWILVIGCFAACGGGEADEAAARAEQCQRMRDHLVELRLGSANNLGKDVAQHRAALTQALGTTFIESCTKDLSASQVACVLGARDSQAATECTTVSNGN